MAPAIVHYCTPTEKHMHGALHYIDEKVSGNWAGIGAVFVEKVRLFQLAIVF